MRQQEGGFLQLSPLQFTELGVFKLGLLHSKGRPPRLDTVTVSVTTRFEVLE